jgi:predicted DNA-binding transcriptional regulator AlpA
LPPWLPLRQGRTARICATSAVVEILEAIVHHISDPILRRLLLENAFIDLDAVPPLLREADIVRDPKVPGSGLLPLTRSSFRDAVAAGRIAKPIRLGTRSVAWRRLDIVRVWLDGTCEPRRRGAKPDIIRELLAATHVPGVPPETPAEPSRQSAVGAPGKTMAAIVATAGHRQRGRPPPPDRPVSRPGAIPAG